MQWTNYRTSGLTRHVCIVWSNLHQSWYFLEQCITDKNHPNSTLFREIDASPDCFVVFAGAPNLHRKLTRSASVTPPITVPTSVSDWLNSQDDMVIKNSQQHYYSNVVIEGHAPLSPQSSVTSSGSGSDTHDTDQPQRNTFLEECSGMKGNALRLNITFAVPK